MAIIYSRENDALNVNPPAGDQNLSEHGSDWLWAVTAIYVVSFVSQVPCHMVKSVTNFY
jgi:bacteriorhodopsin